jgi:hypothetical protein
VSGMGKEGIVGVENVGSHGTKDDKGLKL